MTKIASYFSTFFLGVLALATFQAQLHEQPTWIVDACANAPCTLPSEVFSGLAVGMRWYEDGSSQMCPPPAPGQHPQSTCVTLDPDYVVWVALTRPDLSKVILESAATIYSPALPSEPFYLGVPGDREWPGFAYGSVFGVGLPVNATIPPQPQLPTPPILDIQSASDWWDDKMVDCMAAGAVCGPTVAPIDQDTFNAMLAASPFATAVHSFTLTINGVEITGTTGPPQ